MPRQIYYHPRKDAPDNYVIDARCPEHKHISMKFDFDWAEQYSDHIKLNLHCPICDHHHTLTLSTSK